MRSIRLLLPCVVLLAACDTKAKEQLATLAHTDSLRTDSIVSIKNDLLNEVMTSTQFVNALNEEMAKLKARPTKLNPALTPETDINAIKEERTAVVTRIRELVARLDSSEARVKSLRSRAASLSKHDSTLVSQVAEYERTIADLRQTVEQQKKDYEATIARQNQQITALASQVDTLTTVKTALTDTVSSLTTEKNTAYYVVGTKDELIRNGVLVEEGRKRLLILGGRPVSPARELDPSKFTKIDRLRDRVIDLPAGEYTIFSRQNPAYATPVVMKNGKISGGIRIDQPEKFWEPSKFLIFVRN